MEEIIEKLKKFRDERNWDQFHNNKDLAIALNIETSELLELFLWKNTEEVDKEELKEELADVLSYALLIADKNKLDIKEIIIDKIAKNAEKYPIDKAKNTAKKYNKL
ncbi:dUTP diphosphatase [Flavobacteriales bacterium]|nr:dUTP diphosphatase [Flavobacteriales bacterium]